MCDYATQYPQYRDYYKQYYTMIQEEVSAIQEMQQKRKNASLSQPTSSSSSQLYSKPLPVPSKPASFPPLPSPHDNNQIQAQAYYGNNGISTQQPNPSLTNSDIMYAAQGIGNRFREFDQQHGVSDKCKQVATACAQKAKDLDQEYEVGGIISLCNDIDPKEGC